MSALNLDLRSVYLGTANIATYATKAHAIKAHPTAVKADLAQAYNRFWRFWVVITAYSGDGTFELLGRDGTRVRVRPGIQPAGLRWSRIETLYLPGTTYPTGYRALCDCGDATECSGWTEILSRVDAHRQEHERQAKRPVSVA